MRIDRILVAIDYSDCSKYALEYALNMAHSLDASITALHVLWEPPPYASEVMPDWQPSPDIIERAVADLRQYVANVSGSDKVDLSFKVVDGEAFETISSTAAEGNYQLVVMGTHGRTGLPRLLVGSVAERVVRMCTVPVLTVCEKHASA